MREEEKEAMAGIRRTQSESEIEKGFKQDIENRVSKAFEWIYRHRAAYDSEEMVKIHTDRALEGVEDDKELAFAILKRIYEKLCTQHNSYYKGTRIDLTKRDGAEEQQYIAINIRHLINQYKSFFDKHNAADVRSIVYDMLLDPRTNDEPNNRPDWPEAIPSPEIKEKLETSAVIQEPSISTSGGGTSSLNLFIASILGSDDTPRTPPRTVERPNLGTNKGKRQPKRKQ